MGKPERPRNQTDTLDMHARMQSDVSNLNKPMNASATLDLPARGPEPRMNKPERLKCPTNASNACTCTQNVVTKSRRPTNKSEFIRVPQNGWMKPNSPGISPELRPSPREPETQGSRGCIGSTRARAEHSNRCENRGASELEGKWLVKQKKERKKENL